MPIFLSELEPKTPLKKLKEKESCVIIIDGPKSSGKSWFNNALSDRYANSRAFGFNDEKSLVQFLKQWKNNKSEHILIRLECCNYSIQTLSEIIINARHYIVKIMNLLALML